MKTKSAVCADYCWFLDLTLSDRPEVRVHGQEAAVLVDKDHLVSCQKCGCSRSSKNRQTDEATEDRARAAANRCWLCLGWGQSFVAHVEVGHGACGTLPQPRAKASMQTDIVQVCHTPGKCVGHREVVRVRHCHKCISLHS